MAERIQIIIDAKDQATGAIKGVNKNLKSLGKIALAGGAAVAGGLVAAGAGMIKLASDAEAIPGITSAFESLTAEVEGGSDAMLAALQEGGKGLVTNTELMTSYNKAAALVSKDFANTLPEAMGLVQKAAAATGQDMGFLMDSLVTGVGRVSPMILDNLGIQVQLSNVTERAAEMFGKQADELSKTEQQMALNEIVLEKLNQAYGDTPDVVPKMQQLKTTFANLKDEIGVALLPVVNTLTEMFAGWISRILPSIRDGLTKFVDIASGLVEILGNFFAQLQNGIDPATALMGVVAQLIFMFGGTSETVQQVNWAFWGAIEAIQELWAQVSAFLAPIAQAITTFVQWRDVLIALAVVLGGVVLSAIASVVAAAAPLLLTAGALIAAVALVRNAWENNWLGIRDKVKAVIDFLVPFLQNAIQTVREWWAQLQAGEGTITLVADLLLGLVTALTAFTVISKVVALVTGLQAALTALGAAFTAAGGGITGIVALLGGPLTLAIAAVAAIIAGLALAWKNNWFGIRDKTKAVIDFLSPFIKNAIESIREVWDQHSDAIKSKAEAIWNAIRSLVQAVMGAIQSVINTVASAIQSFWSAYHDELLALAQGAWDAIINYIDNILSLIVTVLDTFVALFTGDWEAFGEGIVNIWTGIWDTVVGLISDLWGAISPLLSSLWGDIKAWFGNVDWASLGRNIIDGIVAGIQAASSAIVNTLKGIIDSAINSIKNMLGIGSPSKVFARIGTQMAQGLEVGMKAGTPVVIAGATGMARQAVNSTTSTVNNYNLSINSNAGSENIIADFELARAYYGGI